MIGPLRRTLTLWVLAVRDMLASAGPVAFLAVGLLVAAYGWLDPQPPKTVRLATGPEGSAYAGFGKRYAAALAREGITVQLIPTGLLVTVPLDNAAASTTTDSSLFRLNRAWAALAASIVTVQDEAVPLHAPSQPTNTEFALAIAVRVTTVPAA